MCVPVTGKCMLRHLCLSVGAFVSLCACVCMCVCVRLSVQVSWQGRTRPSARCSVGKISSTLQAPLLRRRTGSEQVVICLSKYKHGRNNERGFISKRRDGEVRAFDDKALWGFGCLDRWAGEEMTAGVLFPPSLCRGSICRTR